MTRRIAITALTAAAALAATIPAATAAAGPVQGNRPSYAADISKDGRFVVFASDATNLAPGDINGKRDIFLRDMVAKTTRLVSKAGAKQANGNSFSPKVSDDGRYVAFLSDATNLVAGDTNAKTDAFRVDVGTGAIRRVSVGPNNRQANGTTSTVQMSANGAVVAFDSVASNLIAGDTNGKADVFRRDIAAAAPIRISPAAGSWGSSSMSPSGTFIGYLNSGGAWQWSKATGRSTLVFEGWDDEDGSSSPIATRTSDAGVSYATTNYPGDYFELEVKASPSDASTTYYPQWMENGEGDLWDVSRWGAMTAFVDDSDWEAGVTLTASGPYVYERLEVSGVKCVAISGDGQKVAFADARSTPLQIRVWDIATGAVTVASVATG